MREIEFKKIGDMWGQVAYTCEMMPATVSQKTLVVLTELLGRPLLVTLAKGAPGVLPGGSGFGDMEIDDLAQVATSLLFEKLTAQSSDDIIKSVLTGVKAEGLGFLTEKDSTFDNHFKGRILLMYKVFAWSLEVNYRDFFAVARSSPLVLKARAALDRAVSQATATTESGTSSTTETNATLET